MKLTVVIPTRGRLDRQNAMKFFRLEKMHDRKTLTVRFAVPDCELEQFTDLYGWAEVVNVPDSFRYGDIIQYLVLETPGRYKVLMDDDLHLIRRRNPNSISQKGGVATNQDVVDLFDRIREWLGEYEHGGISYRQTNHFCHEPFANNTRANGMMFFDTKVLEVEGVRLDAVQERSDFHVTLSMLELGYPNVVDYEFAIGQYLTGTNADGGCSRYRSPKFLLEQAQLLADLHPGVVKMVYKKRKAGDVQAMSDGDKGIPDVRIQWAKALGLRSNHRKYKGD